MMWIPRSWPSRIASTTDRWVSWSQTAATVIRFSAR
jgi:hypothetical protein